MIRTDSVWKATKFAISASLVLLVVSLVIAGTPGSPGDTTADRVLGQPDFVHADANFIDGRELSLNDLTYVAVDLTKSPNHIEQQRNRLKADRESLYKNLIST